MANDLNLKLKIVADAQGAQDELAGVARQVEQLGDSGTTSAVSLQGLTNALFSLELVQNILSKVGGKLADIANLADQYNTLQARLRLVTDSTTEYSQALDSVQGIALATRADLQATGDLYATLSRSLKALGEDTRQAADLTSTISQAMQLSGASSAAAQGARLTPRSPCGLCTSRASVPAPAPPRPSWAPITTPTCCHPMPPAPRRGGRRLRPGWPVPRCRSVRRRV